MRSIKFVVLKSALATALSICSIMAIAKGKGTSDRDTTDNTDNTAVYIEYSDDEENELDNVVITGQYQPAAMDNAVQKIQVIDQKQLKMMGAQNLRDALTNQLGVSISQDPVLGSTMSMQGISGQNVKILIDGVSVIGRTDGNIDLSQINLNNIERIEIVQGPMAVNYGTDALAGTINLITKKNYRDGVSVGAKAYYEIIGTYNLAGNLGFKKEKQSLTINGGRNFFDGWNPGDKPFNLSTSAAIADTSRYELWKPKRQYFADINYGYRLKHAAINLKSSFFDETILNRGKATDYYRERASDDYYYTRRFDNALFFNTDISDYSKLKIQIAYNQYRRIKNTYNIDLTTLDDVLDIAENQDTSYYKQLSSRGNYTYANSNKKLSYELGYDVNIEHGTGKRINNNEQTIGDYAVFASAEYKPVSAVTVRPGLRYAYNSAYGAPLLPSLNLYTKLNESWSLRASYARGFRAPTVKELYFDFHDSNHNIGGNMDIDPETSDNYSLNLQYNLSVDNWLLKLEAGGYYNNIRNKIELAQTGADAMTYTYTNIGKYKTKGIDLSFAANTRKLRMGAGFLYLGRYNDLSDAPAFSYTPEFNGNMMYDVSRLGMSIAMFLKYTGRSPGYSLVTTENQESKKLVANDIDPYSLVDVTMSKQFFKKYLTLGIGCKNIFNTQNINRLAAGNSSAAHSSGSTQLYIANGRNFFLSMSVNFSSYE